MKWILSLFICFFIFASGIFFYTVLTKPTSPSLNVWSSETSDETLTYNPPIAIFPIPISSTITLGFSTSAPRFVSDWATNTIDIALNGGYFHADLSPSGYMVYNRESVGTRIFDEDKSGLLTITSNTIRIHDLKTTPLHSLPQADFAIQSYPFLINDGLPSVKEDSGKFARRTAIGLTDDGQAYLIISKTNVTLYQLGQMLASTTPPFETVLNLDGGPSTGFVYRTPTTTEILDSITPVPQAILIDVQAW